MRTTYAIGGSRMVKIMRTYYVHDPLCLSKFKSGRYNQSYVTTVLLFQPSLGHQAGVTFQRIVACSAMFLSSWQIDIFPVR